MRNHDSGLASPIGVKQEPNVELEPSTTSEGSEEGRKCIDVNVIYVLAI